MGQGGDLSDEQAPDVSLVSGIDDDGVAPLDAIARVR